MAVYRDMGYTVLPLALKPEGDEADAMRPNCSRCWMPAGRAKPRWCWARPAPAKAR